MTTQCTVTKDGKKMSAQQAPWYNMLCEVVTPGRTCRYLDKHMVLLSNTYVSGSVHVLALKFQYTDERKVIHTICFEGGDLPGVITAIDLNTDGYTGRKNKRELQQKLGNLVKAEG